MSGILELLGLRETQVTPQMVTKAQQKAIDAIALLDHFAADDLVADQAKDALSDRLGHVAGTLDAQRTDILAIAGDAATALKDAKQREIVDLAATDVGRGILDHRVGAMHGKAKTDDDKAFVQAALKARFKIDTLAGDMTTKALPKLYEVLGSVPEWHVRDNDNLKNIKRVRNGTAGASHYSHDAKSGNPDNFIYLELGRTGSGPGRDTEETWKPDVGKKIKVDSFTATTLHEIGHAVDQKIGFMSGHMGQAAFGGWGAEIPGNIARTIAENKGFLTGWTLEYPKSALLKALENVLKTGVLDKKAFDDMRTAANSGDALPEVGDLQTDPSVVQAVKDFDTFSNDEWPEDDNELVKTWFPARQACALKSPLKEVFQEFVIDRVYKGREDPKDAVRAFHADMANATNSPTDADWTLMRKHEAVRICGEIRINAGGEHWGKGKAGAARNAIGTRVYQEGYTSVWNSYSLTARTDGVSEYQFKAPGEWFAELYSFYFQRKMPNTHAAFQWIHDEIDQPAPPA